MTDCYDIFYELKKKMINAQHYIINSAIRIHTYIKCNFFGHKHLNFFKLNLLLFTIMPISEC